MILFHENCIVDPDMVKNVFIHKSIQDAENKKFLITASDEI
jgi:hypothetical protein